MPEEDNKQKESVKPWYKKWWGIILIIIFWPFLIPYLVWTKTNWDKKIKIGVIALCLVIFFSSMSTSTQNEKEALKLVSEAEEVIKENDLNSAVAILEESEETYPTSEASKLLDKIEKTTSEDYLKENLISMSDKEADLLQEGELEKDFIEDGELNKIFISKLQDNLEKREDYLAESEDQEEEKETESTEEVEQPNQKEGGEYDGEEETSSESETEPDPDPEPTNGEKEEEDGPTLGEENALRSAQDYLNHTAFSREGLIEQLEYEGYAHEEAVYGVDNSKADWHQQAEKSAQEYLDQTSFSREGLIEQLEYEGFTKEQAEHGAEAVGY